MNIIINDKEIRDSFPNEQVARLSIFWGFTQLLCNNEEAAEIRNAIYATNGLDLDVIKAYDTVEYMKKLCLLYPVFNISLDHVSNNSTMDYIGTYKSMLKIFKELPPRFQKGTPIRQLSIAKIKELITYMGNEQMRAPSQEEIVGAYKAYINYCIERDSYPMNLMYFIANKKHSKDKIFPIVEWIEAIRSGTTHIEIQTRTKDI